MTWSFLAGNIWGREGKLSAAEYSCAVAYRMRHGNRPVARKL
jgi:hypothetical protein